MEWGLFGMILVVVGVFYAILFVVSIFYCLTLSKALSRCSPQNRTLSPGLVWLLLIPIFNLVWHFFVVVNMAKSLHNEFVSRNIVEEDSPGQGIGLAMCILCCCFWIPYLNWLTDIAFLVCLIVYWVKIAGFSGKIAQPYQPTAPPAGAAPTA